MSRIIKLLSVALMLIAIKINLVYAWQYRVVIYSPRDGAIHGWGEHAPMILIEATVQPAPRRSGETWLTAVFLTNNEIIDRVSLFDDGKVDHHDKKAGDGIFSNIWVPKHAQTFQMRIRAKVGWREAWSETRTIHVRHIPYPRILEPAPNATTGKRFTVRASILQGERAEPAQGEWEAQILVVHDGQSMLSNQFTGRGGTLRQSIRLPKAGRYKLIVRIISRFNGQTVAQDDAVNIHATQPPEGIHQILRGFGFIAIALAVMSFLLYLPAVKRVDMSRLHGTLIDSAGRRIALNQFSNPTALKEIINSAPSGAGELKLREQGDYVYLYVSSTTPQVRVDGAPVAGEKQIQYGSRLQVGRDIFTIEYTPQAVAERNRTFLWCAIGAFICAILCFGSASIYMHFFDP